jgi:hypothetical protein
LYVTNEVAKKAHRNTTDRMVPSTDGVPCIAATSVVTTGPIETMDPEKENPPSRCNPSSLLIPGFAQFFVSRPAPLERVTQTELHTHTHTHTRDTTHTHTLHTLAR